MYTLTDDINIYLSQGGWSKLILQYIEYNAPVQCIFLYVSSILHVVLVPGESIFLSYIGGWQLMSSVGGVYMPIKWNSPLYYACMQGMYVLLDFTNLEITSKECTMLCTA